jgi:L-cysteine:1D-myo-inositol 2-amino-2-deoxy-alpha-D-glucopyranoside ligase
MRLFNTLTGRVEPFVPMANPVRLYVCGVTPYDTTHLGHAFVYLTFDVLIRLLEHDGVPVRYVRNVTDVDDPLFERARETNEAWQAIVERNMAQFHADLETLGARPPDVEPRVSSETDEMIALIQALEAGGYTYAIGERLYFRVAAFPGYGALGGLSLEERLERAKSSGNDPSLPGKENPLDFLLWQPSQPDEPAWHSPWGPGRPGWHIECSAMASHYLGPQIDIHGGGADLIFPHHASEIAQSEAATGRRPFSRFWMHCGLVRLDGVKMSKSLGNLIFTRDLLATSGPDAVRLYVLSHHYREGWDHREEDLAAARALAEQLALFASSDSPPNDQALALRDAAVQALRDDLNTPAAVASLRSLAEVGAPAGAAIREVGGLLGLQFRSHTR